MHQAANHILEKHFAERGRAQEAQEPINSPALFMVGGEAIDAFAS
jgi:hypothetical protein